MQKTPIVSGLRMWFSLLLHWFSSVCVSSDDTRQSQPSTLPHNFGAEAIQRFCLLVVRSWPWTGADKQLHLVFMRSLAFSCEDSVPVCKAMSTVRQNSSSGVTVLQLSAELAASETSKAKSISGDQQLLTLAMAVVSNCCACVEGRQFLWKAKQLGVRTNFLDALDRFHPFVTKNQKPWPQITLIWLQFYEIITRYPDQFSALR